MRGAGCGVGVDILLRKALDILVLRHGEYLYVYCKGVGGSGVESLATAALPPKSSALAPTSAMRDSSTSDSRNTKDTDLSSRPSHCIPQTPVMALFARSARQALLESRAILQPTIRRAGITTISHNLDTSNTPEPLIQSSHRISDEAKERAQTPQPLPKDVPAPASANDIKASPHSACPLVPEPPHTPPNS